MRRKLGFGPEYANAIARSDWRRIVPAASVVLAGLLSTAPIPVAAPIMPLLPLLTLAAWALFQPAMMPAWAGFPLGLTVDLLTGAPLGLNATLLPVATLTVGLLERRLGGQAYGFDWGVMAVVIAVHQALCWPLLWLGGVEGPAMPLLLQAATTLIAYPLVAAFVGRLQRRWFGT